ncbi:type VII secretion integral membrane protein EccD [Longispora urticae]
MSTSGLGLARVTIATPRRRIDVALPEQSALTELLPRILAHAGEAIADDGEAHGGWILRRSDGTPLTAGRTLTANGVRDGEILHLLPRRADWPELDYDDVVDAIATGAKAYGPAWSGAATRRAGLVASGVALALGWFAVLASGPGWLGPGLFALGVGLVLVLTGTVLSRALSDGLAGAVLAAYGLPYGFLGGFLVLAQGRELTAGDLLLGSSVLLVLAVAGYVGVADAPRIFAAGILTALLGLLGALLGLWLGAAGSAALVASLLLAVTSAFPLLSMRLGKLPVPVVPANAAALDASVPLPPRVTVFAAVARADELLTGLLLGAAVVSAACAVVLVLKGGVAGLILAGVVSSAYLLRARLFPAVRHRLPLLGAGIAGLAVLGVGLLAAAPPLARLLVVAVVLLVVAGLVATAGLVYGRRTPSPYLGRTADILDVALVISVIPVACQVLGLYALVRGLAG